MSNELMTVSEVTAVQLLDSSASGITVAQTPAAGESLNAIVVHKLKMLLEQNAKGVYRRTCGFLPECK